MDGSGDKRSDAVSESAIRGQNRHALVDSARRIMTPLGNGVGSAAVETMMIKTAEESRLGRSHSGANP